jgi:thioredoxin 1
MKTVLYFSMEGCGPCKMFWPTVHEVTTAMSIPVNKVDAQRSKDLASQYQITGVPTVIVLKDGQPVYRKTGVIPKTQLISTLQNL